MPKGVQTYRQNYLERQELIKQSKLAAGLIAERFPGVAQIVFRMTYYNRDARSVLMVRTMNFVPNDYAYFHLDCMHDDCVNGGFDLSNVVSSLLRERKKSCKGKLRCDGKSAIQNHAAIEYEVSIQMSKQ